MGEHRPCHRETHSAGLDKGKRIGEQRTVTVRQQRIDHDIACEKSQPRLALTPERHQLHRPPLCPSALCLLGAQQTTN